MKTIFKISIAITLSLYTHKIFSQQELNGKLSAMKSSSNTELILEGNQLNDLVYGSGASLYYENGQLIKVGAETAFRLILNSNTFYTVSDPDPLYDNVELLCIKIDKPEDLNQVFDFNNLSKFKNLRYIHFLCSFELCPQQEGISICESEKISSLVYGNISPMVEILYTSGTIN